VFKRFFSIISFFIVLNIFAQSEPIIQKIEYVNQGAGVINKEYIKAYTSARAGDVFDRVTIARDVKSLLRTKLFTNVEIKTTIVGNEMILTYYLTNKYRLRNEPEIEGNKKFSSRKIRKIIDLNQEDLIDDQVAANLALKLEREYKKAHFPNSKVSWKIKNINKAEGTASITFIIDEDSKEYVKYIYFEGNTDISDSELDKVIRFPVWWNPLDWFRKITPGSIELDAYRHMIREQFLNKGYLDVIVSPGLIGRTKKDELTVTYQIQEGHMYRFGDISVKGVTTFPLSAVEESITAEKDAPASVAVAQITRDNIQDYYGQRGYLNTTVRPLYIPTVSNHVVDIEYKVQEGYLTKINDIIITGNVRTKDKVIRRELLVYPGEIYNTVKLRTSENRLFLQRRQAGGFRGTLAGQLRHLGSAFFHRRRTET